MKPLYYLVLAVVVGLVLAVVLYLLVAPKRYETYVSPFSAGPGLRAIQLTVKTPALSVGPCSFSRYSSEIYTVRYQPAGVEQAFVDAQIERHGDPPSGPIPAKVKIYATTTGASDPTVLRVDVTSPSGEANPLSHDYVITNTSQSPVAPHSWAKPGD